MTVREAIARADAERANTIDDVTKTRWLFELDGDFAETMRRKAQDCEANSNAELLMPYPHDHAYVSFLCAKIDLYNAESELYADDYVTANKEIADAKAWWRRHHDPREGRGCCHVLY